MKENITPAYVKFDEIIWEAPKTIESLDQLKSFLEIREPLFFSGLRTLTQQLQGIGYETISKIDGKIVKNRNFYSQDKLFTAKHLCDLASNAILDGLSGKLNEISLNRVELQTDFNAEEWDKPDCQLHNNEHVIIKASENQTGNILYVDPTYKQIDHMVTGSILCFTEEEIDRFYKSSTGSLLIREIKSDNFPFDEKTSQKEEYIK